MIHSVKFKAVLDTNVIFPVVIRDLLFWFAFYDLYTPKWSSNIFDEWKSVMIRKGVDDDEATKRVNRANLAFPDAQVQNYEPLIPTFNLPDEKDNHIMAAAVKANADVIVTNNLKDFPSECLERYGIKAISADDFLTDIIDLNHDTAIKAFKELVLNKKNPEMNEYQVLDSFRRNGLNETADYLHSLL